MTLLLQFLAVFSILLFFYFRVFRDEGAGRKKHLHLADLFRSAERRSVTRSEWKRGLY